MLCSLPTSLYTLSIWATLIYNITNNTNHFQSSAECTSHPDFSLFAYLVLFSPQKIPPLLFKVFRSILTGLVLSVVLHNRNATEGRLYCTYCFVTMFSVHLYFIRLILPSKLNKFVWHLWQVILFLSFPVVPHIPFRTSLWFLQHCAVRWFNVYFHSMTKCRQNNLIRVKSRVKSLHMSVQI